MLIENTKSLPINLESFNFVEREKKNGLYIKNRCGRDFFYYSLHYYYPEIYNANKLNPKQIEEAYTFGFRLPMWLIWTGLSFYKIPRVLKVLGLELQINRKEIKNFMQFFFALIPFRTISYEDGLNMIRSAVDNKYACGIDISIALGGLVDHVMFVYGYDNDNLYVFDTHHVGKISYIKITNESDNRFIMKLPYSEIKKKWSIFNRIWIIKKSTTDE